MDNNTVNNLSTANLRINPISFMKRLVVGIIIFIIIGTVLITSYLFDRLIMSIFLFILIIATTLEVRMALGERIPKRLNWMVWAFAIAYGPVFFFTGFNGIAFLMLITFIASCFICVFNNMRFQVIRNFAFLLLYPALMMSALLYINTFDTDSAFLYNSVGLFLVFLVSWGTDTFAYLGGSLFGKHKLCPQVSPSKTVEGAIFGIVGGLLGSAIVFLIFEVALFTSSPLMTPGLPLELGWKIVIYIIIGLFGSFCTQIGDLTASLIKRHCGIKDFSKLLRSHGGIMDRFDGIMFNACLVAFIFSFIL